MSFAKSGLLASLALLTSCSLAVAEPAMTKVPTNMLSGPGPKNPVVQHIPADAAVDLLNCERFWCEISWRHIFGFVPQKSLDIGAVPEGAPVYEPPRYQPPRYQPAPVYVYPPPPPPPVWGGVYIGPYPRYRRHW